MARSSHAAMAALAPILGTNAAPVQSVASSVDGGRKRSRRRNQQRKNKASKGRWVPKQFGMQLPAGEDVDDTVSDEENVRDEMEAGVEDEPEAVEEPVADGDLSVAADLTCALTGVLLQDPITTPSGHHYDRAALEEWVASAGPTDPMSGAPLDLETCHRNPQLQEEACAAQLGALSLDAMEHLDLRARAEACPAQSHLADLPPLKRPVRSCPIPYAHPMAMPSSAKLWSVGFHVVVAFALSHQSLCTSKIVGRTCDCKRTSSTS